MIIRSFYVNAEFFWNAIVHFRGISLQRGTVQHTGRILELSCEEAARVTAKLEILLVYLKCEIHVQRSFSRRWSRLIQFGIKELEALLKCIFMALIKEKKEFFLSESPIEGWWRCHCWSVRDLKLREPSILTAEVLTRWLITLSLLLSIPPVSPLLFLAGWISPFFIFVKHMNNNYMQR